MTPALRVFISSMIAFISNFAWAYWVNSMMTDQIMGLMRFALVQGIYSGLMTAGFTVMVERSIVFLRRRKLPLLWLGPLAPMAFQSSSVILVNIANQTPNLWMTVAPSIIFSSIYGYLYTFSIVRSRLEN